MRVDCIFIKLSLGFSEICCKFFFHLLILLKVDITSIIDETAFLNKYPYIYQFEDVVKWTDSHAIQTWILHNNIIC